MRGVADAVQTVAATLWVGGLWITGLVVAPTLFAAIPDRALAGLVAGKLFTLIAWIGMVCAACLIVCRLLQHGRNVVRQALFWIPVVMLALVLAGEFGVQPLMAELRAQALPQAVMESALRARFAVWHGVASVLFLIQCVLGGALVILRDRAK